MIKALYRKLLSERKRNNIRYFLYHVIGILYRGNRYYCVCCDHSFRHFFTYGNIPRPNALCPSCHALERTRLLMYYLKNETSLFSKKIKVLHFAPEKAIEQNIKKKSAADYITADLNPQLADLCMDITNITFPDASFDLVICSHVLGHVLNEAKAIEELYRVLKPGGQALIMTVLDLNRQHTYENFNLTSPQEKFHAFGEIDLVRKHGMDFFQRLERPSVTVNVNDYRQHFSKEEQVKFSLGNGEREMIFVCNKKSI